MTTPLYIFDLDGTLALIDHRRPLLATNAPNRWQQFFAACVHDTPNKPVISTLQALHRSGAECWIWSGRSSEVRAQTFEWLKRHEIWPLVANDRILMRRAGDFTPDEVLKNNWLWSLAVEDLDRLVAVFDDRDKVVAMWREAGVPCFQVAPGEF